MEATGQSEPATDLAALLDAGEGAVVTLEAADVRLAVHRAVLADRSALQQHSDPGHCGGPLGVPEVEGPVLRQLAAYLYTLRAPQLSGSLPQLLAAAGRYGLCDLKAQCERQVAAQLTVETAAAAAVLALEHSCTGLRRAAVDFIRDHTLEVMASDGWAEAVLTHPEDVVELSRLLSEPAAETRVYFSKSSTMQATGEAKEDTTTELGSLLDAGDGAMVTLVAGDTRLVAHRAVLAARSPVFAARFRHDTPEAEVAVPDVEGPVLRQLVASLYTLRAPQAPGMAAQLLVAADMFGVLPLKADCELQVEAQLTVETAAATAVLAVGLSSSRLRQVAADFLRAHTLEVMASQGWADAVHEQPEEVIEMSRVLLDRLRETSTNSGTTTATQPQSDLSQTHTAPTPEDVDISSMLIQSVIAQATTDSGSAATRQQHVEHSDRDQVPTTTDSPVAAETTPALQKAAAHCKCKRRRRAPGSQPQSDIDTHTAPVPDDDVAISNMLMQSILAILAQATPDEGTPASSQPDMEHSSDGQTAALPTAAGTSPPIDDTAVSRMLMYSVIAKATTESGPTHAPQPHTDHSDDRSTPAAACPQMEVETTPTSDDPIAYGPSTKLPINKRLIEAAMEGIVEEVRSLLAAGANVRATDTSLTMWTALHWAADRGHEEVARALLEAGAEVDARNRLLQNTPLHYAAWRGHVPVVRLLLAAGADVNARSADSRTPLHFAAYNDHADTVTVLLQAGADKEAKSVDGHTPLDLAKEYKRLRVLDMLS